MRKVQIWRMFALFATAACSSGLPYEKGDQGGATAQDPHAGEAGLDSSSGAVDTSTHAGEGGGANGSGGEKPASITHSGEGGVTEQPAVPQSSGGTGGGRDPNAAGAGATSTPGSGGREPGSDGGTGGQSVFAPAGQAGVERPVTGGASGRGGTGGSATPTGGALGPDASPVEAGAGGNAHSVSGGGGLDDETEAGGLGGLDVGTGGTAGLGAAGAADSLAGRGGFGGNAGAAGAAGSGPCPEGEQRCGGACFALQEDTEHCGTCGNACSSGNACFAGTCCSPPPAGGTCTLPACGCGNGQVCFPSEASHSMECFDTQGRQEGEACEASGACASGLGCLRGTCKPYCTSDTDCASIGGARRCESAIWADGSAVAGVSGCLRICDPVHPQNPGNPLLACPLGYGCAFQQNGITDCFKTGTGTLGAGCSKPTDCAPGYYCGSGTCRKYCSSLGDCTTGYSCKAFSTAWSVAGYSVGYCG